MPLADLTGSKVGLLLKLANQIKGTSLCCMFAARVLSFSSDDAPVAALAVLKMAEPRDGKIWVLDSTVEPLGQASQQPALSLDLMSCKIIHLLIV